MTEYLTNYNNENLRVYVGYEAQAVVTLLNMPSDDVSADAFAFDIGIEGEDAIYSASATILSAVSPQQILITIPSGTFTEPQKKIIAQIRWTENGGNEKIIVSRFFDVKEPVTPNP